MFDKMTHINSTITRLKRLFSSYGVPEQIITDNATTFMSDGFQQFARRNGILHTTGDRRHPATNGLARLSQRSKLALKASKRRFKHRGQSFSLFARVSHNSQQHNRWVTCWRVLKRHVRTRLDFLKPCIKEMVIRSKQYLQKDVTNGRWKSSLTWMNRSLYETRLEKPQGGFQKYCQELCHTMFGWSYAKSYLDTKKGGDVIYWGYRATILELRMLVMCSRVRACLSDT